MSRTERAWARGHGIVLRPLDHDAIAHLRADPAMRRAIADGVDRSPDGALPEWPHHAEAFAITDGTGTAARTVGVIAIARDAPVAGDAAILVLAVVPEWRGRAAGMRALLVAARRLDQTGAREVWTCVPRTNGHGLYFMLRAGFAPVRAPIPALTVVTSAAAGSDGGGINLTWFRRLVRPGAARRPARAVPASAAGGERVDRPSSAARVRGTTARSAPPRPAPARGRAAGR